MRAHGRSLGDAKAGDDTQGVQHLVWEVAYEHWHRMLFARFLAENGLLLWEPGAAVSLQDCREMVDHHPEMAMGARSEWELAGKLAARMLPQSATTQNTSSWPGLSFMARGGKVKEFSCLYAMTFVFSLSMVPPTFSANHSPAHSHNPKETDMKMLKIARPIDRRHLMALAAALFVGQGIATPAQAQAQTTPVRILVGFPAGGGVDTAARHVADALAPLLGQTFVVDNRSGAGGQLAAVALKQAAPNGQTLFMSNDHTVVIVPQTLKSPGFNPAVDFVPVARVTQIAFGLAVHPSTQAQRLADHGLQQVLINAPPGDLSAGAEVCAGLLIVLGGSAVVTSACSA